MRDDLVPDVSLGTHFLNELVEMDMLYLAFFPKQDTNTLNNALLEQAPNRLADLAPDAARWEQAIRVIAARDLVPDQGHIFLNANALEQKVFSYRSHG
jgi:hypothetical protein